MILTGCRSNDAKGKQDHQVSGIRISPEDASLEVAEENYFSIVALTASGETVDTDELDNARKRFAGNVFANDTILF